MQIQSEQINELATAISKAQGIIEHAKQDKTNPFYKSKYADLSCVWESCRSALSQNGLSVIQTMLPMDQKNMLVTTLLHSSGQWIRSWLPLEPTKKDPQGLGACITYMKRYALAAIVGIATEDDDGEGSIDRSKITHDQAVYLHNLLKDHDDIHGQVMEFVKKNKGKRISDILSKDFEGVKKSIIKNIEKKKKNKVEIIEHQEVQNAAAN